MNPSPPSPSKSLPVLVVDDDPGQLMLLEFTLQSWGHKVETADSAQEALSILEAQPISLVISDWMMPGMNGLELCRALRAKELDRYVYVILLTAREQTEDVVEGLEAGANDFISKPHKPEELRVRLNAGQRIIDLERRLQTQKAKLAEANRELSTAYAQLQHDLEAAAALQKSLLPNRGGRVGPWAYEGLFLPYAGVAGDVFNVVPLSDDRLAFYLLDVAGHGISAAMMAVAATKMLSDDDPSSDLDLGDPSQVLDLLNRRFLADETMHYLTIVYGVADGETSTVTLGKAGHPAPLVVRRNGTVTAEGAGSFPIGFFEDVEFDRTEVSLEPGDRLIVFSDGVVECRAPDGTMFSDERLAQTVTNGAGDDLTALIDRTEQALSTWHDASEYEDDVSLLALERTE